MRVYPIIKMIISYCEAVGKGEYYLQTHPASLHVVSKTKRGSGRIRQRLRYGLKNFGKAAIIPYSLLHLLDTTMMPFDTLDTEEKAEEFRKDRLDKIDKGKLWSPMSEGPYCVVHWLPISKKPLFSPSDLNPDELSKFIRNSKPIGRMEKLNSDGVRFHSVEKDETQEEIYSNGEKFNLRPYWNAQIFRSGALEMVTAVSFCDDPPGTKRLYQEDIIGCSWKAIDGFKECMSHFKITNPIIVGVSLLRVEDYKFSIKPPTHFTAVNPKPHPSKDEQIVLPRKRIKQAQDIGREEQKIFDRLWIYFGYEKCEYYDEDGKRRKF